jgi:hypothetical protein
MAPRPLKRRKIAPKVMEDKLSHGSLDPVANDMVNKARNTLAAVRKPFSCLTVLSLIARNFG